LNVTNPAIFAQLNQTPKLINRTNNFWYSNNGQTGLTANIGSSTGGLTCSITPLLDLYCIATPVLQASVICSRTDQKQYTFSRKTTYANEFNIFEIRSQSNCTLYL
jgi:hypothetical protein